MGNQASSNISPESENIDLANQHLTKLPFTPPTENKAKNLNLSGNKFVSLPENMNNVIFVDLSKNQMGSSIPAHVAKALSSYINLKELNLSSNQLEKLNDVLKSNKIELINLTQNRFTNFPDHLIVRFPTLETFYFDCNFLNVFSKLQSELIVTLTISLNCIQSIDTSSISLPQLTTLDLSKNQIKAIPDNLSKCFPSLKTLDLSDNFIEDLPEVNSDTSDNFVFPKSLVEINFTHNFLGKIPKSIICLPNLKELNVAENKITEIPEMQSSLEKINVLSNQVNNIVKQTMKGIKEIVLTDNKLTEFPNEIEINECQSFILDHNQIKYINFSKIPNTIIELEISFNQIEILPRELFKSLPNLQSFSANFNKITEVPVEIINCTKLQSFSISYNPIKELPKMPISLQSISASNCQIKNLDGIFYGIKQPSRFYSTATKAVDNSSDPSLDDLSPSNFHSQNYTTASYINLKFADFSGNELVIFPDIHDIQILNLSQNHLTKLPTITNHTKILDVSLNQITSESMPEIITGTGLVELNLSHNKLTKVPKFQNVPLLQCLELSGNPLNGTLDVSELIFLDVVDISSTSITTIKSKNELLREVITSRNDLTFPQTVLKVEPKTISAAKKKVLYVNQKEYEEGKYRCGFSEMLGLRKTMEDSIIVRDDLNLYAVCDGHGGSNTAKYIAIKISDLFEKKIENQVRQINMNKSMHIKSNINTFEKVKHLIESVISETQHGLQSHEFMDGSTLCLCYLHNDYLPPESKTGNSNEASNSAASEEDKNTHVAKKLITAHMGDSRAIIVRKDATTRELTKDHKPYFRNEFEKIHKNYGKISKDNRVDGILAVSRAMGDFHVQGVCREAEIVEFDIDDEMDKFLVICCDGVFDVLTNDEVAQVVINAQSPIDAAFMIRNAAFGVQSSDNISVIVVDLTQKLS